MGLREVKLDYMNWTLISFQLWQQQRGEIEMSICPVANEIDGQPRAASVDNTL